MSNTNETKNMLQNMFQNIDNVADSWEDELEDEPVRDEPVRDEPVEKNIDAHEFPVLGYEPKKEKDLSFTPVNTKGRAKRVPEIEAAFFQPKEHAPLSERNTDRNNARTAAFNALADVKTEKTQERLYKTRMCHSVETGEVCPHGDGCRFAHSSNELRTAPCLFGGDCCFVRWRNGNYFNNPGPKVCTFLHLEETKRGYCARLKIPYIEEVEPPKLEEKVDLEEKVEPPKLLGCGYLKPSRTWQAPAEKIELSSPDPVKINPPSVEEKEDEIVLTVPKELALQAMELAMKSGKKNIRVEIC